MVESGDVVNDLPGNQDPIPGRLIGDTDTVEKPRGVGNTDLSSNPARLEFEEQSVETRAMLVTEPCHVTVAFHQQAQHRNMIIGFNNTEPV
jgi:hypothetical protein